mmetsp:Transcript_19691/g.54761  ORF Transcript_19691/g.54761 Transcript_19691/m.54761 type:complete len:201 (-) Transcript_19691:720-1322(-)
MHSQLHQRRHHVSQTMPWPRRDNRRRRKNRCSNNRPLCADDRDRLGRDGLSAYAPYIAVLLVNRTSMHAPAAIIQYCIISCNVTNSWNITIVVSICMSRKWISAYSYLYCARVLCLNSRCHPVTFAIDLETNRARRCWLPSIEYSTLLCSTALYDSQGEPSTIMATSLRLRKFGVTTGSWYPYTRVSSRDGLRSTVFKAF